MSTKVAEGSAIKHDGVEYKPGDEFPAKGEKADKSVIERLLSAGSLVTGVITEVAEGIETVVEGAAGVAGKAAEVVVDAAKAAASKGEKAGKSDRK